MEMFSGSRQSQVVLFFGLLMLVVSVTFSLYAVSRLKTAFVERLTALETQDSYYDLEKKIKNWAIIFHSKIKEDNAIDLRQEEQALHNIETAKENIIRRNTQSSSPSNRVLELGQSIDVLTSSRDKLDWKALRSIDIQLEAVSQIERDRIEYQGHLLLGYINKLVFAAAVGIALALLMIVMSFVSKTRYEKEQSRMIAELQWLKEVAESASHLKSKFLSTVSHEIRTPLNGIIGISDILMSLPPSANTKVFAKTINQSGKTLLRIINDILDFSKIEAGKIDLSESSFSIIEVLNQVLLTLSPKAAEKSLNLNYEIDPRLPKFMTADPERISQVLFNLVGNAIKFTEIGSVIVRVKLLEREAHKVLIEFSVEDTGIGLSKQDIDNLFTPFVQVSKIGTSGESGSGLGLSISQSIVKAMGGKITVDSEPGRGTQFSFTICISEFSSEMIKTKSTFRSARVVEAHKKVEGLSLDNYKPRVLIAEDNPTNQIVAESMLTLLDVDSVVVSNGQEALDLLSENSFDLILMDCQMPILDGLETARILRSQGNSIPILAMTANAFGSDEKECLEAGMNDYVSKPVELHVLRRKLVQYLSRDRSFSNAAIVELDSSIGRDNRKKVINTFLSTLPTFRTCFDLAIENNDLNEIRRIAHRFSGSSLTVGGTSFNEICRTLENAESVDVAKKMTVEIDECLDKLEEKLRSFS